jgi:polyphosphate kinase
VDTVGEDDNVIVAHDWTSLSEPPPTPAQTRRRRVRRRRSTRTSESVLTATSDGFINRELSWLDFNSRVLSCAEDTSLPLLERVKFLAIAAQGLDEFFQVRVAGLKEQLAAGGPATLPPDGMTVPQQLGAIRLRTVSLVTRIRRAGVTLMGLLSDAGITIVNAHEISDEERTWIAEFFTERVFPVLTPLAVDPAHPFPYISNLSLNLAVLVRDAESKVTRFARVKVPPLLPRLVALPGESRFIPLEQVIALHLDALFPGLRIVAHHPFRITRNADLDLEEGEAEDLLIAVESELRRRRRFADVVRLEIDSSMSERVLKLLLRELDIEADDVYVVDPLLDLGSFWALYGLPRADLKPDPWIGSTPAEFDSADIFDSLRRTDVIVQHPYDSFTTSVERFIEHAAKDAQVLAIKQTLYRVSSSEAGILEALMGAAESGKQVVVIVELKARFDEQANIEWARRLEESGVHVVYGVVGLKTHAKLALVVRQEGEHIRHYMHVGTGNYNRRTARIYEDIGLLSADSDLGHDVVELFNQLTGYSKLREWRRLLVAPTGMRDELLRLIGEQAHERGRIAMKMNSLVDALVIEALYEASRHGAKIDLIVRGICCLRPGIPGQSETIRVRSLVGRFLEHSRLYRFGTDLYYIGSADLMPRNLDRRVEALVSITQRSLRLRLDEILRCCLSDNVLAWELGSDGKWKRAPLPDSGEPLNGQTTLQFAAMLRSHVTPVPKT